MKSEIGRVSIDSLCLNVTSGGTPLRANPKFWEDGNIPWYKTAELKDWYVEEAEEKITEEGLSGSAAKIFPANTVLMAMYGDGRTITSLGLLRNEAATNQACCAMIANPLKCNYLYLFYALKHHRRELLQLVVAGAQRNLSIGIIRNFEITYHSLETQSRIANILSTYDDLIENNRRRIDLLEQSVRMLYKEWFVSLRFPGHEHVKVKDGVPQGWEKTTLGEIAPLNYGKSLKADERIPGEFPVYGSSGIVGTHEKALVPGPGIIVGRKGNAGSAFWSMTDFYPIDTTYYIESGNSNYFVYYLLLNTQFVSSDVAVPGLNRDYAHSLNIVLPDKNLLSLFEEMVSPIHKQIYTLEKSTETITTARDLLLPRLMNGEIPV